MQQVYAIIEIASAATEVIIFNVIAYKAMAKTAPGTNKWLVAAVVAFTTFVFFCVNIGTAYLQNMFNVSLFAVKSVVVPALFSMIVWKLYRVKPLKATFFTLSTFYILNLSDLLLGILFAGVAGTTTSALSDVSRPAWYGLTLSSFILKCLLAFVLIRYFAKMKFENKRYWRTVTISILLTYIVSALIGQSVNELQLAVDEFGIVAVILLLFGVNIIQVQVLNRLTEAYIQQTLEREQQKSRETIEQQHNEMNQVFSTVRQLAHDSENEVNRQMDTLATLKLSLASGKDVISLLDDSIDTLTNKKDTLQAARPKKFTGRAELDRNIEMRKYESAIKNIDFVVETNSITDTSVDIVILHSIVTNLLSNAFEAAQHYSGDDNQVFFKIWQYGEKIEIVVRNKFSSRLIQEGASYRSTKAGEDTGNGLAIVESFVKEVNGVLELSDSNNTFIAIVEIPLQPRD